jgi:stage II sporulation protein D
VGSRLRWAPHPRLRLLLLLFLLLLLLPLPIPGRVLPGAAHGASHGYGGPALSVAVQVARASVQVGAARGFQVVDARSGAVIDRRWGAARATVEAGAGAMRYGGRSGYRRLRVLALSGGWVTVDGRPYRGSLDVQLDSARRLDVVNAVDLESYLYGVVRAEMGSQAPIEALKAQAIASRTFALKNRHAFARLGYGLRAGEHCQVYGGVSDEDPRASLAVDATRGLVLTSAGALIDAWFHATCGGRTENNEDVWSVAPVAYARSVACPPCQVQRPPLWTAEIDYDSIARRLRRAGHDTGAVTGVAVTPTRSGRVRSVFILSPSGVTRVPGNEFRLAIDRRLLRSLCWYVPVAPEPPRSPSLSPHAAAGAAALAAAIVPPAPAGPAPGPIRGTYRTAGQDERALRVAGRGSGHGVGLCQTGAATLAAAGHGAASILRLYYQGVDLARAYH